MRAAVGMRTALVGAWMAGVAAVTPVAAQSPEAAEIAACLCLQRAIDALGADLAAKQRDYGTVQDELSRLDAQLQTARSTMDVSNPQAVARFRELLERRDAVYKRSIGLVTGDIGAANQRYNTRVGEYNSRCANRPRDPGLVASIQATLSCPPGY